MPKYEDEKSKNKGTFTEEELNALRGIAEDWLHQQLLLPPFPPATRTALEKLGVAFEASAPESTAMKTVKALDSEEALRSVAPAKALGPIRISPPLRTQ